MSHEPFGGASVGVRRRAAARGGVLCGCAAARSVGCGLAAARLWVCGGALCGLAAARGGALSSEIEGILWLRVTTRALGLRDEQHDDC